MSDNKNATPVLPATRTRRKRRAVSNDTLTSKARAAIGRALGMCDPFSPVKGEVAVWQAVLTQALMDAASGSKKPEALRDKNEALRWLRSGSEDFATVCFNAGFDPDYIRRMVEGALARGCKWRQEAGAKKQATPKRAYKHIAAKQLPAAAAPVIAVVLPLVRPCMELSA